LLRSTPRLEARDAIRRAPLLLPGGSKQLHNGGHRDTFGGGSGDEMDTKTDKAISTCIA
jgi:hypothetical protein